MSINFDEIEKIKADVIVSFGIDCRVASALKRNKLRYFSNPFDWMMRYSLDDVIKVLSNKGNVFFENIEEEPKRKGRRARYVICKDTGMVSMHDFSSNVPLDKAHQIFKKVMSKRFERTDNIFKKAKTICIVTSRKINIEEIKAFLDKFLKLYQFEKVYYINAYDCEEEKFSRTKLDDTTEILEYYFSDKPPKDLDNDANPNRWQRNVEYWNKIMKRLSLNRWFVIKNKYFDRLFGISYVLKEDSIQKIIRIFGIKFKIQQSKSPKRLLPKTNRNIIKRKLIAVSGFWCSGSSTVCDMLSEFKNTISFSHRKNYSGSINSENNTYCELKFFQEKYSVLNLVQYIKKGNNFEQDYIIKRFIEYIYEYYNENKNVSLFQNYFLDLNKEFLDNILELDDYTKDYMKGKYYPSVLSKAEDTYEGCCFVHNYLNHPYVFYKFKKLSAQELDVVISNYFYDFFNNIKGADNLILDQIFGIQRVMLDKMNFYMNENPIKEICVWRDPRDEYVNLWRDHLKYNKIMPEQFICYYKRNCVKKLKHPSKNRLDIRFEDMVLDYDKTTKKILDFLELDAKDHIYKKQIFIPEKSKVNIGEYKEFHDQKIIEKIAKGLKDYLYR